MPTVFDSGARSRLEARVHALRPDSPRRWGRMSPHEAVCHLSDAFRMALGERPVAPRRRGPLRPIVRFVALHLPFNWPSGIQTLPEAEQGRGGTAPIDFGRDRTELLALIARFGVVRPEALPPVHPLFGTMSAAEWGRWGYRHLDHHLRQFSV